MIRLLCTCIFPFLCCTALFAGTVDTLPVFSPSMHRTIPCIIITPERSNPAQRFPVLYLLHGWSGNYSNWITKEPLLKKYADDYQMIIACPDGGFGSWYFDSPLDSSFRFETFVAGELPAFVDSNYATLANRQGRAITGLSMGGHGALWLAFRHAGVFGAAGSMSGGVDLMESAGKFDISKRIGDTSRWHAYNVLNLIEQKPANSLALLFDCGVDDFFIEGNRRLHRKMLALRLAHDYTERPGQHDWNYWKNTLPYHLLFFHRYFMAADRSSGK